MYMIRVEITLGNCRRRHPHSTVAFVEPNGFQSFDLRQNTKLLLLLL